MFRELQNKLGGKTRRYHFTTVYRNGFSHAFSPRDKGATKLSPRKGILPE